MPSLPNLVPLIHHLLVCSSCSLQEALVSSTTTVHQNSRPMKSGKSRSEGQGLWLGSPGNYTEVEWGGSGGFVLPTEGPFFQQWGSVTEEKDRRPHYLS